VEIVQAAADVGPVTGHQGFQRIQKLGAGLVETVIGGGAPQLAVDEVVCDATNVVDLHAPAGTENSVPTQRAHLYAQATEAGGVDVGNVLAGDIERHLCGANAAIADLAQETHERFSLVSGRIGWAKAADACADASTRC